MKSSGDLVGLFDLFSIDKFHAFDDFPWFKDASIGEINNVEKLSSGHFYWPDLDVDIGIETIQHPERFPLKAR